MNVSKPMPSSVTSSLSATDSSSASIHNDSCSSNSCYDSALENLSSPNGFESISSKSSFVNPTTDTDVTLSGSSLSRCGGSLNDGDSINISLPESERTDNKIFLDEVDPKSQLANKTIFKTDNPNLSIIEISDSSEKDLEESIILIESSTSDEGESKEKPYKKKSPKKPAVVVSSESGLEKRRRKAETLIHSSKQKLNLVIAEASATESNSDLSVNAGTDSSKTKIFQEIDEPETKREIKVYDTLEEFDKNLPKTVSILNTPFGSKVYLVGTAHFSEESQDDVSYVIRNVRPDVVMVELCPSRSHILKLDEKTLLEEAKNINIAKIRSIINAHGYINGIFFILLLQMSAQIAKDLGMAPGGEFRRAFDEIHKLPGCMLHLGDRPIRVTLNRALHALSFWQTIKLVYRLTSTDSISVKEVEECKQQDLLEKLMQEMAGEFPAFSEVFVKERDMFLCHSLQLAALPQAFAQNSCTQRPVRVVGVVGIGHANGIAQLWGRVDPQKIPAIMEIPPPNTSTVVCKFTIKYGLIGLTLFGAFKLLRPRLTRYF